jgi:hypothetical protein
LRVHIVLGLAGGLKPAANISKPAEAGWCMATRFSGFWRLSAGIDPRAAQRQRNQSTIDLLDAWAADAQDTDDSWWPSFAQDLDAHRTSDRPLYPETAEQNDAIDAIALKRRIQEQIYEETKHMAPEEFIAYMRQRIANS